MSSRLASRAEVAGGVAVGDDVLLAARWTRVILALRPAALRTSYLREELRGQPVAGAARALDVLCHAADAGDARAMAALHAFVELVADPQLAEACDSLRDQARAHRLLALERTLRRPFIASTSRAASRSDAVPSDDLDGRGPASTEEGDPTARLVPDYGKGRPLTLGERKSLARRPPPDLLPKILDDPHPDVIRMLLSAPQLTEEHVIRLAARRPNRADILHEVARHPRWCHRPRIRLALVLNPATPTSIAISMVILLRRNELALVVETTAIHPSIRSAARERLERLPPVRAARGGTIQ